MDDCGHPCPVHKLVSVPVSSAALDTHGRHPPAARSAPMNRTRWWHANYALGVVLIVFLAVNIRWIAWYRPEQPYDIDEAGYLTYALVDFRGLMSNGIAGWIKEIEAPSYQAPFVTALTSLVFAIVKPSAVWGFATMIGAGAIVIWTSFKLAERLGGTRAGIFAALLAASCPAVLNGSRGYNFGLPAAAVMGLALIAMQRSSGFRAIGWSVAFGLLVGLLPLTRTMTLAFIPGLGLAALVTVLQLGLSWPSLLRLGFAGLIAVATMAVWLVPNGQYVMAYLLEFGYGHRAALYNAGSTPGLVGQFVFTLSYLEQYVYFPHLILMALGGCALLVDRLLRARSVEVAIARSPALSLVLVVLFGLVMLMTSSNKGTAFANPLLVPLFALVATGLARIARPGPLRAIVFSAVGVVVAVPSIAMTDLKSRLAWPLSVTLPVIGQVTVSDGIGPSQHFAQSAGYRSDVPTMPVSLASGRQWTDVLALTAQRLNDAGGGSSLSVLGLRGYLINTNSINFIWMFKGGAVLPLTQITPEVTGDTVEAYTRFLVSGEGATGCRLLTATGVTGEIQPPISPDKIVEAAREAGFQASQAWPLPDGRTVTLWQRPTSAVPCLVPR